MYEVRTHTDPNEFREVVLPFLLKDEALNNLLIGLTNLLCGSHHEVGKPLLFSIHKEGGVIGVALRTGDTRALICSHFEPEIVPYLRAATTSVVPPVKRVTASAEIAAAFAKEIGLPPRLLMSMGVYACDKVILPKAVSGMQRLATAADLPQIISWTQAFAEEAVGSSGPLSEAEITRLSQRIKDQHIMLWCDPEPVSQVYVAAFTPNGARITGVYTPKALRGKGYASACVASLTEELFRQGRTFTFLYTDMKNPTSNKIYQQIGFRYLATVEDVAFGEDV